jgi:hypothetical protein
LQQNQLPTVVSTNEQDSPSTNPTPSTLLFRRYIGSCDPTDGSSPSARYWRLGAGVALDSNMISPVRLGRQQAAYDSLIQTRADCCGVQPSINAGRAPSSDNGCFKDLAGTPAQSHCPFGRGKDLCLPVGLPLRHCVQHRVRTARRSQRRGLTK